jgi:hypothetical protein
MAAAILMAVLTVAALQGRVAATAEPAPGRRDLPAVVEEALWWLPADTETVMVARGPFQVADLDPRGPGALDPRNVLRLWAVMGFPLEFQQKRDAIGAREVSIAIAGSLRFRIGDAGTGMMIPYDGAEIIAFKDDLGPLGDEVIRTTRRPRSRIEMIGGHQVRVEETSHPDPDIKRPELHYFARPRPNILIHATDREYLANVFERMAVRPLTRALPANLPEWARLDPSAPFWCIRHYDRKQGAEDPTSPFSRLKPTQVAAPSDEQAIGVVVSLPADAPQTLRVTYLRAGGKVPPEYQKFWRPTGLERVCQVQQARPEAVVVSISLAAWSEPPVRASVLLLLLTALGHLVII